jgi:hypothetical protein
MRYGYNPYKNQVIDGQMCIWLQYFGFHPAKLATEFKVGDRIAYNTGESYEVIAIEEKSKKQLLFTVQSRKGEIYKQAVNKDTYKPHIPAKPVKIEVPNRVFLAIDEE